MESLTFPLLPVRFPSYRPRGRIWKETAYAPTPDPGWFGRHMRGACHASIIFDCDKIYPNHSGPFMARRGSITALGQLAEAIALVSQGQPGHIVDTLIADFEAALETV